MNDTINQLYTRKSVRSFTDQDIDEALVTDILTAAAMAPTAGNQQLYTILRITDQTLKEQLAESCDHQPFIAKAKLVLVFLADPLKWHDAYQSVCDPRPLGVGDVMLAIDDALIAAQNAVTAAWSMGIGSCYIGDIMENIETQQALLQLPDEVFPAAMVVFGYPTKQQLERSKPQRVALHHIVQENTYHRLDDASLQDMLSVHCPQTPYAQWLKAFCERKFNSDFSREMTRSVMAFLRRFHV